MALLEQTSKPKLGRNRDFGLFWLADNLSLLGTLVTSVAMPIVVYQLTGLAFFTSLTTALRILPYLLFGFLAGVIADKVDRKRLMVSCDVVNALLLASIPLTALFKGLTLPHILLVALGSAMVFVWFDAANWGAIPALVGRERIAEANSLVWTTNSIADVTIPAVAGGLVILIGPSFAVGLEALTFSLAAVALLLIRHSFNLAPNKILRVCVGCQRV